MLHMFVTFYSLGNWIKLKFYKFRNLFNISDVNLTFSFNKLILDY